MEINIKGGGNAAFVFKPVTGRLRKPSDVFFPHGEGMLNGLDVSLLCPYHRAGGQAKPYVIRNLLN
jgi:hypothetical protein